MNAPRTQFANNFIIGTQLVTFVVMHDEWPKMHGTMQTGHSPQGVNATVDFCILKLDCESVNLLSEDIISSLVTSDIDQIFTSLI